jgi:DNA (cytosine-5)-methyltransferase 1
MLRLHGGRAMRFITRELGRLGYRWAYRVIDTRAFGLPQRRLRTFILASRVADPAGMLLGQRERLDWPPDDRRPDASAFGFYWTEGNTGIGWAKESVPPLKGGSGFGIPSPPAIWLRSGRGAGASILVPGITDAERLQGFEPGWTTLPADEPERFRWRLVGNAVSVPVSKWIGERIVAGEQDAPVGERFSTGSVARWPAAAYGDSRRAIAVEATTAPIIPGVRTLLSEFLDRKEAKPLSLPATKGFLSRLERSRLHVPGQFVSALRDHITHLRNERAVA